MKDTDHSVISVDAENTFDKIQNRFRIKNSQQTK